MGTDIKNLTIKIRVGKDPQFKDFDFSKLSGNVGSGNILYHSTKQYPIATLLNQNRKDRLSFLTDNKKFQTLLNQKTTVSTPEQETNIINNNIINTLFVLFPTFFEQKKNISTSYDERISKDSIRAKYNLFQVNRSIITTQEEGEDEYVYYDNKTVDKLVWLNDVYNVPEYVELLAAVYKFFRFTKDQGKIQVEKNLENNATILEKENIKTSLRDWKTDLGWTPSTPPTKKSTPEGDSTDTILKNYEVFVQPTILTGKTEAEIEKEQKEKDKAVKGIMEQLNYLEGRIVENDRSPKSAILNKIIKAFTPLVSSYKIKQMFAENRVLIKNEKVKFSKEEERLYSQLNEYTEYKSLEEAILKFKKEVIKSSNPDLDRLLTNFQDNSKEEEQKEFLYFVLAAYRISTNTELLKKWGVKKEELEKIQSYETKKNLLYVGPVQTTSGKHLIYVGLDVISSKLSQKEHTSRNCVYKNEKLGDFTVSLYNKLFGSYLQGIENFIVLNNEYILDLPKPPAKPTQGQPIPPAPPAKGGKRLSRKKRANKRRPRTKRRTRGRTN